MTKKGVKPVTHRVSLSLLLAGGGIITLFSGWAAAKVTGFMSGMQAMADAVGLGIKVTGATLLSVAIALKAASHFWKWFGKKYRAFLSSYNLKP